MPVLNLNDDQASLIAIALQRLGDTNGEYTRMCNELTDYIHQQRAAEEADFFLFEINQMHSEEELNDLGGEELEELFQAGVIRNGN